MAIGSSPVYQMFSVRDSFERETPEGVESITRVNQVYGTTGSSVRDDGFENRAVRLNQVYDAPDCVEDKSLEMCVRCSTSSTGVVSSTLLQKHEAIELFPLRTVPLYRGRLKDGCCVFVPPAKGNMRRRSTRGVHDRVGIHGK